MRICGIDPGLETTGYGVIEVIGQHIGVVDAGVITSNRRATIGIRLKRIYDDLHDLLTEHKPAVLAVEKVYSHYKHPQTAVLMGHARGVILLAAGALGMSIHEYPATQIKKMLTGHGRAGKSQVQRAIQIQLSLPVCPEPPDVADALAAALGHLLASRIQDLGKNET